MLGWLKRRSERRRNGQQFYERIVAQARTPSLFERCGVPDTMDGRLEMLLLHTVLSLDRLRAEGVEGQRLGQRLMERLVDDVDDALRRIGLGDDSIVIRVKRLTGAIAERSRDYGSGSRRPDSGAGAVDPRPLDGSVDVLDVALREHIYGTAALPIEAVPQIRLLADYVHRARSSLADLDRQTVLSGRIIFPSVIEPRRQDVEIRS